MSPAKCALPPARTTDSIPLGVRSHAPRQEGNRRYHRSVRPRSPPPFTLASHLRGTDIFLDVLLDDQFVHDLLDYCYKAACKMAEYFIDAGTDVIAVVDPLISQISTEHFE